MPRLVLTQGKQHGCAILAGSDEWQQIVTLSSRDRTIVLHRIVLTEFSPYFRDLLQNITVAQPVLMLDVPFVDLLVLADLMYHGMASVPPSQLSSVRRSADTLAIGDFRIELEETLPLPATEDDDEQAGPSGLGRIASYPAEVPALVELMDSTSLAESDAQPSQPAEPIMMETWTEEEQDLAYAIAVMESDSTGNGAATSESNDEDDDDDENDDSSEDQGVELMDFDMLDESSDEPKDPSNNAKQ